MAEVLGAVASSFAVAEVAIKAGDTVAKLRRLWTEVKEVPNNIRDLMAEIEILDPLLSEIEGDLRDGSTLSPLLFNDAPSRLSAGYCRAALESLRELVDDLSSQIECSRRSTRTVSKIKVALKKDVFSRLQERLCRAVRLLNSAQLGYLMAVSKLQPDIIVAKLESRRDGSREGLVMSGPKETAFGDQSKLEDEKTDRGSQVIQSDHQGRRGTNPRLTLPNVRSAMFGRLALVRQASDKKDDHADLQQPIAVYAARFQAPTWLSATAWELYVSKAISGWQFNLKSYSVQPEGALVFEYAETGNIVGLRQLFADGLASPRDCDEIGWSLLQYAAMYADPPATFDTVLSLLDSGADPDSKEFDVAVFYILKKLRHYFTKEPFPQSRLRALVTEQLVDNMEMCHMDWPNLTEAYDSSADHAESLAYASWQTDIFEEMLKFASPSNFYELPVSQRIWPYTLSADHPWNPKSIRLLLHPAGRIQATDIEELTKEGVDLLHLTLRGYGKRINFHTSNLPLLLSWRDLVHDIIAVRPTYHELAVYSNTPKHVRWALLSAIPGAHGKQLTPLMWFLLGAAQSQGFKKISPMYERACASSWSRYMNKALRHWLGDLKRLGLDLCEYGKQELFIYNKVSSMASTRWTCWEHWRYIRKTELPVIRGFRYGATPEDWYLEWDMEAEEFAGQFWDKMDEGPPLHIPGAWIDDECIDNDWSDCDGWTVPDSD